MNQGNQMAAKKRASSGVNKSAFIRDILTKNNEAKPADVNAAWAGAGHKEKLNQTLYYQVKKSLGLSSGRRKKRGRKPKVAGAAPVMRTDSSAGYLSIENSLDGLIIEAQQMRDSKLAEALRTARRVVSSKLL